MAVKGERPLALVAGEIASAAAHKAEAPGHCDLDGDALPVQTGDLSVLLNSGDEQNDDGGGESHEESADDGVSHAADVYLHAGPPKSHDGLSGGTDAPRCHLGVTEAGPSGAGRPAAVVGQCISYTFRSSPCHSPRAIGGSYRGRRRRQLSGLERHSWFASVDGLVQAQVHHGAEPGPSPRPVHTLLTRA